MRFLLLPVALAALALACSAPQAPAPASSAQSDAPRSGGVLKVRVNPDPFDWDITYNGKTSPNEEGLALSYNSLLGFQQGPDLDFADLELRPELAESWEISPDARTYTFHLRKGVKFANLPPVNGRALTSADVKWSYEYLTRSGQFKDSKLPEGQFDYFFEGLTSFETPDPYTVVVRFSKPFVPFINYAASEWNIVEPHEIYDQNGNLSDVMVGTGPYIWDAASSQKGSRTVFKKNPNYWDPGKPYLDEIQQITIKDESAAVAAFQTKQIDILRRNAFLLAQDLRGKAPDATEYKYVQPRGYHLYISQNGNPALHDVRVRRAIAEAVDRDAINRTVAGGEGKWAMPGAMSGVFTDAQAHELQKRDPNHAKELLAQAGYGRGLSLEWPVQQDETQANLTWFQVVQAQLKEVGIDVNFKILDKKTQRQRRYAGEFDLDAGVGLGTLEADNDSMLYAVYHSGSTGNYSQTSDPELDKLLDAQRQEADHDKRLDLIRAASRRIVDQAWAVEFIYPPISDFHQSWVRNAYPNFGSHAEYAFAWLAK